MGSCDPSNTGFVTRLWRPKHGLIYRECLSAWPANAEAKLLVTGSASKAAKHSAHDHRRPDDALENVEQHIALVEAADREADVLPPSMTLSLASRASNEASSVHASSCHLCALKLALLSRQPLYLVCEHVSITRQAGAIDVPRGIPQACAIYGLGTMEVGLLYGD